MLTAVCVNPQAKRGRFFVYTPKFPVPIVEVEVAIVFMLLYPAEIVVRQLPL
jgi:hypothetical protein